MAQYVVGSVALNTVPPVTFWPAIIFTFTGFHTLAPAGALNAGPYFQLFGSSAPWFCAPVGGVVFALLFWPAGAANGKLFAGCCPCATYVAAPKLTDSRRPRPKRVIAPSFTKARRFSHQFGGPAKGGPYVPPPALTYGRRP